MSSACIGSSEDVRSRTRLGLPRARARSRRASSSRRPHRLVGGAVDRRLRLGCARVRDEIRRSGRARTPSAPAPPGTALGERSRRLLLPRERRLAVAAPPARGADEARVGLDRGHVDAADLGDAAGDRGELHRLEEGDERLAVELGRRRGASSGVSTATSRTSVTSCFRDPDALDVLGSVSASRRFGCLISPARASSVSRSPYSPMSCAAVLTPMPGAPGTLSVESPASAWTSTTLSGPDAEIVDHLRRADAPLLAARPARPGRTSPRPAR